MALARGRYARLWFAASRRSHDDMARALKVQVHGYTHGEDAGRNDEAVSVNSTGACHSSTSQLYRAERRGSPAPSITCQPWPVKGDSPELNAGSAGRHLAPGQLYIGGQRCVCPASLWTHGATAAIRPAYIVLPKQQWRHARSLPDRTRDFPVPPDAAPTASGSFRDGLVVFMAWRVSCRRVQRAQGRRDQYRGGVDALG